MTASVWPTGGLPSFLLLLCGRVRDALTARRRKWEGIMYVRLCPCSKCARVSRLRQGWAIGIHPYVSVLSKSISIAWVVPSVKPVADVRKRKRRLDGRWKMGPSAARNLNQGKSPGIRQSREWETGTEETRRWRVCVERRPCVLASLHVMRLSCL
ncbi:hypothetical protein LZ32DRAFT_358845 [Colletotrichum eremochloae]|nr:hypothetical protein LZ32DRAFT_358845 [Colletotrichum eremochloae]